MKNKYFINLSIIFVALFYTIKLSAQCTTPTISGLSPTYCVVSPSSSLSASSPGGMFQGNGVIGTNFYPALAGPGTATVYYGTCTSSYAITSSTVSNSGLTYSIIPTSSSESGVFLGDDQTSSTIPIGFSFNFFCSTYTAFVISSNGFISFNTGVGNGCCSGGTLPNGSTTLDNLIASCWTDLNPGAGGTITYATLGTAPNRTLFVNYNSVPFFSGGGSVTNQIRLLESSNVIEIHTNTKPSSSSICTMGIENAGGSAGFAVPGRNASASWTASLEAVRFTPVLTCVGSATTFVSPTSVSVTGASSICAGSSTTLNASGNTTYTWTGGTSSNNSNIVVNPTANTSYSVSATNSLGCTANAVVNVTVFSGLPSLAITTSTNSTCLGKTVTLTATGAVNYSWTNSVLNGVGFTPTATANYVVSGSNACGTATALTTVSVVPYAVFALASPSVICAGGSSTFNAVSAANLYTWMPSGATTASVILGSSTSQIFTVTASDGTCIGMATVALVANPVPTIVTTPTLITSLCAGDAVTLTASGALSYTWSPVNLNGATVTVTPTVPTNYQVSGSNSFGCTSNANIPVITQASPTLNISATTNFICEGDPVDITVSGANTYTWNTGLNTTTINVNPVVTTVYSVVGEINGCTNSTSITVTVFSPTLSITGNTAICSGKMATITASGANNYNWSNGQTTNVIQVSPSSTTLYTVTALTSTSGINCPSSGSFQVIVLPNPTLSAAPTRTTMCKNETNTISVTGASTYSWNTGATTNAIILTPSLITTYNYTVVGTNSLGCSSTTTTQVKVSGCVGLNESNELAQHLSVFPNPNNGSFMIKFEKDIHIKIMNELGQLVQSIEGKDNGMNTETIQNLAAGVYFVIAERNNQLYTQKIIVQ